MLENGECINRSLNILYLEIKQIFNVIFHKKIQLNKKINAKLYILTFMLTYFINIYSLGA